MWGTKLVDLVKIDSYSACFNTGTVVFQIIIKKVLRGVSKGARN